MMLVKTRLALSSIEGIGIFAAEPIRAGTITWRFQRGLDQVFTHNQILSLPDAPRRALLTYCYRHAATGLYVLCADHARFMNHADQPNTKGIHPNGGIEGYDVARRDIAAGEELTCDYRTFDADVRNKLGDGLFCGDDTLSA